MPGGKKQYATIEDWLDNLSDADRRKLMLAMLELDNERKSGVGHPTPDEREGKRVLH